MRNKSGFTINQGIVNEDFTVTENLLMNILMNLLQGSMCHSKKFLAPV